LGISDIVTVCRVDTEQGYISVIENTIRNTFIRYKDKIMWDDLVVDSNDEYHIAVNFFGEDHDFTVNFLKVSSDLMIDKEA